MQTLYTDFDCKSHQNSKISNNLPPDYWPLCFMVGLWPIWGAKPHSPSKWSPNDVDLWLLALTPFQLFSFTWIFAAIFTEILPLHRDITLDNPKPMSPPPIGRSIKYLAITQKLTTILSLHGLVSDPKTQQRNFLRLPSHISYTYDTLLMPNHQTINSVKANIMSITNY